MPDSRIRPIAPDDVPAVVELIYDLAEYERLRELCHITTDQLRTALFGPTPALFGLVAVDGAQLSVVGYALYFLNFSTWEGVHGIYLEDLYVRPDARGRGAGKALLRSLARRCLAEGLGRLEWAVLDWNAPAIGFYDALGAQALDDWIVRRLTGEALARLAAS